MLTLEIDQENFREWLGRQVDNTPLCKREVCATCPIALYLDFLTEKSDGSGAAWWVNAIGTAKLYRNADDLNNQFIDPVARFRLPQWAASFIAIFDSHERRSEWETARVAFTELERRQSWTHVET